MMFRTSVPVAEPASDVRAPESEPVPISVLSLDLDESAGGWVAYLKGRGITVIQDDIGRAAIARADARQLFDEHHENERRKREMLARQELEAEARDQEWRSRLPHGLPWYEVPDGVLPVVAMTAADRAAQPRRTPSQTEWLFGEVDDTMVFHSLQGAEGEAS